ncbi:MAG: NYN domain-containing protein [Alphaproteobacteria bacterium]|nr:NYN domain-containing protein [Alphaproteobacteria bacterium]
MRTFVYIDGLNLYYRMLKGSPKLKWLNPKQLATDLLSPANKVERVCFYTARISPRPSDPNAPARQAIYLKALASVPEIRVHTGSFLTSEVWMPLTQPPEARPKVYNWSQPLPKAVRVVKTEEKGTDVSLGAHLVRDAFTNMFDVAVVLTNDSDLIEPIRIAVQDAKKTVGLFAPVEHPNQGLKAVVSFCRHVRKQHLSKAQFPDPVVLPDGSLVTRPSSWR